MDGGTQSRAVLSDEAIGEYRDLVIAGLPFKDPIVVFHDGENHWLADGFHRVKAVLLAGRCRMDSPVDVRQGTRRDAVLYSVGANTEHGIRRTNEDKRRAVETLLNDAEWSGWSDRKISEACGVGDRFVSAMRKERVSPHGAEIPTTRKVERGGVEYVMNTAAIGKAKPPAAPPAPKPRVTRDGAQDEPADDVPVVAEKDEGGEDVADEPTPESLALSQSISLGKFLASIEKSVIAVIALCDGVNPLDIQYMKVIRELKAVRAQISERRKPSRKDG